MLSRILKRFQRVSQTFLAVGLALSIFESHAFSDVVLKVSDVTVQRSLQPQEVKIPVIAISDQVGLKLSGFNLIFDLGADGQGPLPAGVSLPAALPDTQSKIASGGEVNRLGWFLVTTDARDAGLALSDILITGNSPAAATDISLLGNPSTLQGGAILFNLSLVLGPNAPDRFDISLPSELGALPLMADGLGNAMVVTYLQGSVTLVSVPGPGGLLLVLAGVAGIGGLRRIGYAQSRGTRE